VAHSDKQQAYDLNIVGLILAWQNFIKVCIMFQFSYFIIWVSIVLILEMYFYSCSFSFEYILTYSL